LQSKKESEAVTHRLNSRKAPSKNSKRHFPTLFRETSGIMTGKIEEPRFNRR